MNEVVPQSDGECADVYRWRLQVPDCRPSKHTRRSDQNSDQNTGLQERLLRYAVSMLTCRREIDISRSFGRSPTLGVHKHIPPLKNPEAKANFGPFSLHLHYCRVRVAARSKQAEGRAAYDSATLCTSINVEFVYLDKVLLQIMDDDRARKQYCLLLHCLISILLRCVFQSESLPI